jgi:hypothetical protein
MANEIAIEELRAFAQRIGLTLPDDELQRLLPGVNRAQKQAAELRTLIDSGDEPAAVFIAANKNQ